jgi:hypothetical protein
MPSRKQKILEKRKENRNLPHVTADDIVQAIEGVQAAGLGSLRRRDHHNRIN